MTEWITDRRPTEADGDNDGDVAMQERPGEFMHVYVHWSHVGPGAPWMRTVYWRPPAQPELSAVEPSPTQPRRFVSLTRTVAFKGYDVLDAIDQDGRAWWRIAGDPNAPKTWTELLPLPTREEQP